MSNASLDRGRVKTRQKSAAGRAERNFSDFLRFSAGSGLEKANKTGACENVRAFSHGLDRKRSLARQTGARTDDQAIRHVKMRNNAIELSRSGGLSGAESRP
jgi:hypothetical protein